jgi:hypothetical protein
MAEMPEVAGVGVDGAATTAKLTAVGAAPGEEGAGTELTGTAAGAARESSAAAAAAAAAAAERASRGLTVDSNVRGDGTAAVSESRPSRDDITSKRVGDPLPGEASLAMGAMVSVDARTKAARLASAAADASLACCWTASPLISSHSRCSQTRLASSWVRV